MFYSITNDTILLLPKRLGKKVGTIVYEKDNIFELPSCPTNIIRKNCLKYGSTLEGRIEFTKHLIEVSSKVPILVKESEKIIFFPIHSYRAKECCWINLNNYKLIKSLGEESFLLKLNKDYLINLNTSYNILNNQINISSKLYYEVCQLNDI